MCVVCEDHVSTKVFFVITYHCPTLATYSDCPTSAYQVVLVPMSTLSVESGVCVKIMPVQKFLPSWAT